MISNVPSPIAHQIHFRFAARNTCWLPLVVCPWPTEAPQLVQTMRPPRERSARREVDPQRGQRRLDIDCSFLGGLALQVVFGSSRLYYFVVAFLFTGQWLRLSISVFVWIFFCPLLIGVPFTKAWSSASVTNPFQDPNGVIASFVRQAQPWISQQRLMPYSWCWRIYAHETNLFAIKLHFVAASLSFRRLSRSWFIN